MTGSRACPNSGPTDPGAVSVAVLIRSEDGTVVVDEHLRAEPSSSRAQLADVLVVDEPGPTSWSRVGARDRELATSHPGALVTMIVCGPTLALVRIGGATAGPARRTSGDPSWPVYASILHALTVREVAPR
ncbi:hypothetical protein OG948_28060 [Embleya sp. NBC_00888]|uniref:hypothetical protein n=1 Tax=Embleya sp. NBC_00888 TaxID=2975960 RepID=UPI00386CA14E|nr:hypothetical protein OG948_28060 [Embleya sp. NBC_00888]